MKFILGEVEGITNKMKVLLINSVFNYGSTGRIVKNMYDIIVNSGNKCCIAYGRGVADSNYNTIKIGSSKDICVHGIMTRLTDKHGFYSKSATKNLIKKIENFKPDIIHLHNIHGYYINIKTLFLYLKHLNIPVVWTLHDCWAFTGHCPHYEYVNCNKWKSQCLNCPQRHMYPKAIFKDNSKFNYINKKEYFTMLENLNLVVPSNWLYSQVKESYLKKYRCTVIYNGIDLLAFSPLESNLREQYKLQDKKIILGVASVWGIRKGLNTFIELSKHLDNSYKIILIGVSKSQVRHLPENILGIERTESIDELAKFYSIADIFLNPTMEDNFPTTNLEALACGTPVYTFDTGGSPESIDEHSGKIIVNQDINSILDQLSDLPDKNSSACIERSKKFNMYDAYNKYMKLYEELLCDIYS